MNSQQRALMSRRDVARIAGVGRTALANWERRYENFPKPVRSEGAEYFRLSEIASWAAERQVPAPNRRTNEPVNVTYGDRIQAFLDAETEAGPDALDAPAAGDADSPSQHSLPVSSPPLTETQPLPATLLRQPDTGQRGVGSRTSYLVFLLGLVFLRVTEPEYWQRLKQLAARNDGRDGARQTLDHIGRHLDAVLRRQGMLIELRGRIDRVAPQSPAELAALIASVDQLGRDAFHRLLDQYAQAAGLDSQDSVTPHGVTRLVALVFSAEERVQRLYDPHARSAEMLSAVLAERGHRADGTAVDVVLGGTHSETRLLAVMNMMLHGVRPAFDEARGTNAPWRLSEMPPAADLVLVNPPFNAASGPLKDIRWPYGTPPAANNNFAWAQYAHGQVRGQGRAAIVLPNSAGFSANSKERAIRQSMVEAGAVECVIALPARLFTTTAIPVNLWILRPEAQQPAEVLLIDGRDLGKKVSRKLTELTQDDVALIAATYRSWRKTGAGKPTTQGSRLRFRSVDQEEIIASGCSLNPADYTRPAAEQQPVPHDALEAHNTVARLSYAAARVDTRVNSLVFNPRRTASASWPGLDEPQPPQRWEEKPLNSLCRLQAGPSPVLLKDIPPAPGEVPLVLPRHLRNRRVAGATDHTIPHHTARSLERFCLEEGDILCVRTGTVGPTAQVHTAQRGWLFGSNLVRLHQFAHGIDPHYLLAFLTLPTTVEWIQRHARRTTVPSISTTDLGELPVIVPPLPEQRCIAGTLETFDDQIAAHLEVVEAAHQAHTAMAEQMISGTLLADGPYPIDRRNSR